MVAFVMPKEFFLDIVALCWCLGGSGQVQGLVTSQHADYLAKMSIYVLAPVLLAAKRMIYYYHKEQSKQGGDL